MHGRDRILQLLGRGCGLKDIWRHLKISITFKLQQFMLRHENYYSILLVVLDKNSWNNFSELSRSKLYQEFFSRTTSEEQVGELTY